MQREKKNKNFFKKKGNDSESSILSKKRTITKGLMPTFPPSL